MPVPRFRIRTLMIAVAVVGALVATMPAALAVVSGPRPSLIHLIFCRWLGFEQKDGESTFPYDHNAL